MKIIGIVNVVTSNHKNILQVFHRNDSTLVLCSNKFAINERVIERKMLETTMSVYILQISIWQYELTGFPLEKKRAIKPPDIS